MTVGGAMSGYCSIGKLTRPISPTSRISTDTTQAKMGRSIKSFSFIIRSYNIMR